MENIVKTELICNVCRTVTIKKPGANIAKLKCKGCDNIGDFMENPICDRFDKLERLSYKYRVLCEVAKHVYREIDLCVKRQNYFGSDAYDRNLSLEKAAKDETSREFAKIIAMIDSL